VDRGHRNAWRDGWRRTMPASETRYRAADLVVPNGSRSLAWRMRGRGLQRRCTGRPHRGILGSSRCHRHTTFPVRRRAGRRGVTCQRFCSAVSERAYRWHDYPAVSIAECEEEDDVVAQIDAAAPDVSGLGRPAKARALGCSGSANRPALSSCGRWGSVRFLSVAGSEGATVAARCRPGVALAPRARTPRLCAAPF